MSDTLDIAVRSPARVPILPLAILVYAVAALVLWPATYVDMFHVYLGQVIVLPVGLLLGLPVAALILRPREPIPYLASLVRESGPRLAGATVLVLVGLSAFTTFKLGIPKLVPFYADPWLADLDAAMHFGNPGELVHAIVPGWLQYPLGFLYGPAWFLLWFGFIAFVAAHRDRNFRRRYFWSMALAICTLGTLAAIAFSSVGPILYERIYGVDRFPALMAAIAGSAVGDYMALASGYLYENYLHAGSLPGTGISAMPSVHLAIATLNALALTKLNRIAGIAGWTYVAIILVGSVYLGWHYAIDGYFSIAVVAFIWWLTGRYAGVSR